MGGASLIRGAERVILTFRNTKRQNCSPTNGRCDLERTFHVFSRVDLFVSVQIRMLGLSSVVGVASGEISL